jgi:hypothetical protein
MEELRRLHHALELPSPTDVLSLALQGAMTISFSLPGFIAGRNHSWIDWLLLALGMYILFTALVRHKRNRVNKRERDACVAMLDGPDPRDRVSWN